MRESEILSVVECYIQENDSGLEEGEILEYFRESDQVENTLLVLEILDDEKGDIEKKDGKYIVERD